MKKFKDDELFLQKLMALIGAIIGILIGLVISAKTDEYVVEEIDYIDVEEVENETTEQ